MKNKKEVVQPEQKIIYKGGDRRKKMIVFRNLLNVNFSKFTLLLI